MNTARKYALVAWTPEDVQTLAPALTDTEAEAWLDANAKHIQSRLVEMGYEVIESLLRYDGVDLDLDAEEDTQ